MSEAVKRELERQRREMKELLRRQWDALKFPNGRRWKL